MGSRCRGRWAGRAAARGSRWSTAPIVLEGGSILSDGAGTLLTTEQCLLNPNRNPDADPRSRSRTCCARYLGVERIVWLGHGLRRGPRHRRPRRPDRRVHRPRPGAAADRRRRQPQLRALRGERSRRAGSRRRSRSIELPFLPYAEVAGRAGRGELPESLHLQRRGDRPGRAASTPTSRRWRSSRRRIRIASSSRSRARCSRTVAAGRTASPSRCQLAQIRPMPDPPTLLTAYPAAALAGADPAAVARRRCASGSSRSAGIADPEEHEAALAAGIRIAAGEGARIVCLQELTLSPYFAITPDGPEAAGAEPEELESGATVGVRQRGWRARPGPTCTPRCTSGPTTAGWPRLQHRDRRRPRRPARRHARASCTSR